MSEKVKVTKEQAEWLDKIKTTEEINFAIDVQLFKKRPDSPIVEWKPSKLARALYIGYEAETKEDTLRNYYYDLIMRENAHERTGSSGSQFRQGWQSVKETLNILGITIEGINDKEA